MRRLLALLLLATPAQAQLPGVADSTARRPVTVAEAPWSSLVRVQSEAGGRCTGVLIAPDRVLTAAHCLVARLTRRLVLPGRVHVLAGYDRGNFTAHATGARLQVGPGFRPETSGPIGADWALLRLATPLPGPTLPLAATLPAAGAAAMLGGWQQDRAHALLADTDCQVQAVLRDAEGRLLLRHGCAATRGVSGGPLLVRHGEGWAVAGVAVGATSGAQGGLAVAVPGLALGE
ncbi:trypsin-like serine peptidase [Falsiroseomonas sp. E2-1-a4]|uniref:trypsin-like serine peptidase n=1 Tax=Falsiroseomonas sp. E2-1-a4 TaxID=3239299 RepID=UPI003F29F9F4